MNNFRLSLLLFIIAVHCSTNVISQNNAIALEAFNLRTNGELEKAENLLKESIFNEPQNALAYFELARLHTWRLTEGLNYKKDIKILKKRMKVINAELDTAISLEVTDPRFYYLKGNIISYELIIKAHNPIKWLGIPRSIKKGRKYYERTIELEPGNVNARWMVYKYYNFPWIMGGRKKKAEYHLDELMKGDKVYWAVAVTEGKSINEAEETMLGIIKEYPESAFACQWLALKYENSKQYEKAIEYWNLSLRTDPVNIWSVNRLMWCYIRSNQENLAFNLAKQFMQDYQYLEGYKKAVVLRHLGRIYKNRGDIELSKSCYNNADILDPTGYNANVMPMDDLFVKP